ncbi:MAG TPA: FAD-dependent oxidoreductase [Aestuariivirgaceae bacterium]|nr:FAD-dependent oxidoreductase [Aestuariivirgaceae bacterium]
MATSDPEILVVGAGPVGLAAALELARRGFSPRIIDNDAAPTPESRALGVNARTLELLEPSGATERLLAHAIRINGFVLRMGLQELARVPTTDIPHRFNFMLSLPQSDIERLLIEALAERDIAIDWRTRLQSLDAGQGNLSCRLEHEGTSSVVQPATVIGADGAHSVVRKSLGIGFGGESFPGEWGLADVVLADWPFPFDRAVITLDRHSVCGFIPMAEGFGRFVSNHPDVLDRLPPDARVKSVVWQSTFRISFRQVSTYQQGNAFLAGDAAHIHSPVGGRGMNLGIEDACWLAWLKAEGRTQEYTALRWPAGRTVLDFTEQQMRQIVSRSLWADVLRRWLAPAILKLPAVRRRLLSRVAGLDTAPAPWLAA